jgi:hypothetical protein
MLDHATSTLRRITMPNRVLSADLKSGDVFLYHGQALISSLIRLLDGEPYSHAAIFLGEENGVPSVAEMLNNGVNTRAVSDSVQDARFVDVYRYVSDCHQPLGTLGVDPAALVAKMNYFIAPENFQRYGFEQILLLAMLCTTREIKGIPGEIIRRILDHASEVLAQIIHAGKEPMICSELVYRCFMESSPAYDLTIVGADVPRQRALALMKFETVKMATTGTQPALDQPSHDAATSAAIAAFLANYSLAKGYPAPAGRRLDAVASAAETPKAIATFAVADFVTPNDLGRSPNLQLLGTYAG